MSSNNNDGSNILLQTEVVVTATSIVSAIVAGTTDIKNDRIAILQNRIK